MNNVKDFAQFMAHWAATPITYALPFIISIFTPTGLPWRQRQQSPLKQMYLCITVQGIIS